MNTACFDDNLCGFNFSHKRFLLQPEKNTFQSGTNNHVGIYKEGGNQRLFIEFTSNECISHHHLDDNDTPPFYREKQNRDFFKLHLSRKLVIKLKGVDALLQRSPKILTGPENFVLYKDAYGFTNSLSLKQIVSRPTPPMSIVDFWKCLIAIGESNMDAFNWFAIPHKRHIESMWDYIGKNRVFHVKDRGFNRLLFLEDSDKGTCLKLRMIPLDMCQFLADSELGEDFTNTTKGVFFSKKPLDYVED